MKRDMDLVRRIAIATADLPPGEMLNGIEGVDPVVFAVHVAWMVEGGLVSAHVVDDITHGSVEAFVFRLTWAGCEFADAVASDTLWAKAKASVIKPTASWTFNVLLDWLKAELSKGLPTVT